MYLLPIKCLVRVNASEQDKHAPHIPGVHRLRDWQTLKSHLFPKRKNYTRTSLQR
jgi:hypothetical protein